MKRGDVVKVTTGDHAGQVGRVICIFGGWASVSLPDGFTFGVKEAACKLVQPDAAPTVFAREHMNRWPEAA